MDQRIRRPSDAKFRIGDSMLRSRRQGGANAHNEHGHTYDPHRHAWSIASTRTQRVSKLQLNLKPWNREKYAHLRDTETLCRNLSPSTHTQLWCVFHKNSDWLTYDLTILWQTVIHVTVTVYFAGQLKNERTCGSSLLSRYFHRILEVERK